MLFLFFPLKSVGAIEYSCQKVSFQ